MPATLQRELPLPRVTLRKPTLALDPFGAACGWTPDEVLLRIEDGTHPEHLRWAWNIASDNTARREIRVLTLLAQPSLRDSLNSFDAVLKVLFPPRLHAGLHPALRRSQQFVWGTELAWALSCDSQHVINLIEISKHLRVLPGTRWRTGPNGSPSIAFESVTAFLQGRLLATTQT